MSVRKAAWVSVVVGIAIVLAFGIFLGRQSFAVSASVRDVLTTYAPAATQGALLDTSLSDMQRGVSNYLITGDEADLGPFVNGSRRSDLALGKLDRLLGEDPPLADLVQQIAADRTRWIEQVARPTIDARRAGQLAAALRAFDSSDADGLFAALQSDTATLVAMIEERTVTAFTALASLTYSLIISVIGSIVLICISLALGFWLARRKVLRPLDDLRHEIRSVARQSEHTRTITPSGPEELYSLGADVEELRRLLVDEIDEARSARQALDHNAPVVAAIRSELTADAPVAVRGLSVAGTLQPAEGVLAGDWWDSALLPTGEAAVIVADISGHGPEAGIAAMRLKYAIVHDLHTGLDIATMATTASEVFQEHPDRFATVAAVCVDPADGAVRYINAGHHGPLLLDEEGRVVQSLDRTGPILSWLGGSWSIGSAVLRPGQTILMFSDGLIESHDSAGEELGEELLKDWLREVPADQREPDRLIAWLIGAARQRAVDWKRDDVTVVAVRRTAGESG